MLERLTDLSFAELLWGVLAPMALLQVGVVAFYIIWGMRTWPRMPRREAILYAPLAIPLGFTCFFVALSLMAGGKSPLSFAGILALIAVVTWLPGVLVGAVTFRTVTKRRDAKAVRPE